MILRYTRKWIDHNSGLPYNLSINKTYQCLPTGKYGYGEVLVYNDSKEWQLCQITPFAPIEPNPLIEWEE